MRFPSASVNLTLATQWQVDEKDDRAIFFICKYSIFFRGNNTKYKTLNHPPNCQIPLIPVNEVDGEHSLFNSAHSRQYINNKYIGQDGLITTEWINKDQSLIDKQMDVKNQLITEWKNLANGDMKMDQHSMELPSIFLVHNIFHVSSTVRGAVEGSHPVCTTTSEFKRCGCRHRYEVWVLNYSIRAIVAESDI